MDRTPEELQTLGFIGIFKEAYKTIFTWKKIFTQFTLVFIFPKSALLFSLFHFLDFLAKKIYNNINSLDYYVASTINLFTTGACLLVIVTLSLSSTFAMVYIIGCIYTATEISFKTVLIAVPKVCNRIMAHILLRRLLLRYFVLVYSMMLCQMVCIWCFLEDRLSKGIMLVLLLITILVYMVYALVNFKWHASCLVNIFEDNYVNRPALQNGWNFIIYSKFWAIASIVCTIQISELLLELSYYLLIVHSTLFGVITKVCLGVVCFLLLSKTILLGFVIQSLLYFVCKSYLRENVNILVLKSRLEGYSNRVFPVEVGDGSAAAV